MQRYANQMLDAFNDETKVIKSHIPAANVPTRINVPVGQNNMALLNYCITVACQTHDSCRKDTCPEKVNTRTCEY